MPNKTNLVVLYPKDAARELALAPAARIVIGRDPACDLCFAEDSVSREHCEIFEKEGQFFVCDLGSANGTCVNGVELASGEAVPLPMGAHLQIGSAVLALQAAPIFTLLDPAPTPEQFHQEETEFWGAAKNVRIVVDDEPLKTN
jgi:pSer/pThr/pTyr-binding forkhead associated (FHA) protein